MTMHRRSTVNAFTLVELIISVALVVVLLAGVNMVFTMTSDTVGAGQAISSATRDNRAAQSVFYNDLKGAVTATPPAFIIRSQRQYAFNTRADHLSDLDADPLNPTAAQIANQDLDNDGVETGANELTTPALYNNRSHRVDKLLFFARDLFPRQTGGATTGGDQFIAPMSSTEAYVWYGHLNLPDFTQPAGSGNSEAVNPLQGFEHRNPGEALQATGVDGSINRNDLNFYASDWILGRVIMLLRAPAAGVINDDNIPARSQWFIDDDITAPDSLSPLVVNSDSSQPTVADRFLIQWSRYDLVGTTISEFTNIITTAVAAGNLDWFHDLANFRYQANPVPTRPHSGTGLARTVPIFLPQCSQFIVEYAGDFVKQNRDPNDNLVGGTGDALGVHGDVQDIYWSGINGKDGVVDFYVDPATNTRKTRWYGMPRDTDGDRIVRGVSTNYPTNNNLVDVVPLRDVLLTCLGTPTPAPTAAGAPFERELTTGPAANQIPVLPAAANGNYADATNGMGIAALYNCAWGPDVSTAPLPTAVRITVVLSDPAGRLGDGQTFEYVIDLP